VEQEQAVAQMQADQADQELQDTMSQKQVIQ
jgi:hypothetical protein